MLRAVLIAIPCLLTLAAPATAQRPPPGLFAPTDPTVKYVESVAMVGMFKIETSKSVLRRGQDEAVRRFAKQVLDEQGWLTAQLAQTADDVEPRPTLPAKLDRPHKRLLAELNAAPRGEVDRLYIRMQVQANEDVLAQHTRYAVTGPVAELRALAETAKPIVQAQLKELRQLSPGR